MDVRSKRRCFAMVLAVVMIVTSFYPGSCMADVSGKTATKSAAAGSAANKKIKPAQADEMALALTDKMWVWDWVAFFVPYMSKKGVKKLLPASKDSEWAKEIDMTTGKKLKFTKKQIKAARKNKTAQTLTRKDIDGHALLIMQSNGDWDCISFMLPYMSHKGIRAVVRCYNKKHGGKQKQARDYY